jgi:phosphoglycolate phosphatase-like HAD superfamily hydrolase
MGRAAGKSHAGTRAMNLKDIKAITFDVGGTLIEPFPSVGHIYAEIAAQHGHGKFSPEELNRRFVRAWKAQQGSDLESFQTGTTGCGHC